jgi:hypothetical protein
MEEKYNYLCNKVSDINEHLPTLFKYSKNCESVFETGVRGVVSSWAFAFGLKNNNKNIKNIYLNDIVECDISELYEECKKNNINLKYEWKNNLELEFQENETYDITFIDTWHIYGQLKRELNKFSKITKKYIIMHDTTGDAIQGEHLRCNWDGKWETVKKLSEKTGIPTNEIITGLEPAIDQFLDTNPEWKIKERFHNNNGLMVLEKII